MQIMTTTRNGKKREIKIRVEKKNRRKENWKQRIGEKRELGNLKKIRYEREGEGKEW